jgi:hypothetical protein
MIARGRLGQGPGPTVWCRGWSAMQQEPEGSSPVLVWGSATIVARLHLGVHLETYSADWPLPEGLVEYPDGEYPDTN